MNPEALQQFKDQLLEPRSHKKPEPARRLNTPKILCFFPKGMEKLTQKFPFLWKCSLICSTKQIIYLF